MVFGLIALSVMRCTRRTPLQYPRPQQGRVLIGLLPSPLFEATFYSVLPSPSLSCDLLAESLAVTLPSRRLSATSGIEWRFA